MSTAYYLLPGARLPKDVAPAVIPRIDRSLLDPILEGLGTPVCQRLAEGLTLPFARCTHHLWFWGVVPRGKTTPAHAAYVWLEDHGPTLATEIWSVTPCVEENGVYRSLGSDPLTAEEIDRCSEPLRKTLAKFGFALQQWDTLWYATRMKDWEAVLRPWECQDGMGLDEGAIAGDRDMALECLRACAETMAGTEITAGRKAAGRPAPNAVWIAGGGRQIRFYPPTLIRAVMSDEPVLRSWAMEAGMLCQFVSRTTGKTWPEEAAPGDMIAVISDLWEPWLRGDWDAWLAALPGVASKIAELKAAAIERKTESTAIVACGLGTTATLLPKTEGLKSRFLSRFAKKTPPDYSWLTDSD